MPSSSWLSDMFWYGRRMLQALRENGGNPEWSTDLVKYWTLLVSFFHCISDPCNAYLPLLPYFRIGCFLSCPPPTSTVFLTSDLWWLCQRNSHSSILHSRQGEAYACIQAEEVDMHQLPLVINKSILRGLVPSVFIPLTKMPTSPLTNQCLPRTCSLVTVTGSLHKETVLILLDVFSDTESPDPFVSLLGLGGVSWPGFQCTCHIDILPQESFLGQLLFFTGLSDLV